MMNKNDQQFMAQKIRTQYMEKQPSELDELRALDTKVKRPALIFSYAFGSFGALVMGSGMSLVMTDIAAQLGLGDMTAPGIVIGVIGLAIAIANYPLYKTFLNARKKKYASKIMQISEKILNK